MESFVNYEDFLKDEYSKKPHNPMQGYYENKGVNFKSNQFFDEKLRNTENTARNLMELIKSGRSQGFSRLEIACLEDYINDFKKYIQLYKDFQLVNISFDVQIYNGLIMVVQYPEIIKINKEIKPLRSRTKLHSKYMEPSEIDKLEKECYPNLRTEEKKKRLIKEAKKYNELFGLEDMAF